MSNPYMNFVAARAINGTLTSMAMTPGWPGAGAARGRGGEGDVRVVLSYGGGQASSAGIGREQGRGELRHWSGEGGGLAAITHFDTGSGSADGRHDDRYLR